MIIQCYEQIIEEPPLPYPETTGNDLQSTIASTATNPLEYLEKDLG